MRSWGCGPAVGLALSLVLCGSGAASNWGLRVASPHGATELEDGLGFGLYGFARTAVSPRWWAELDAGYNRLRGADYATDITAGEGRLLYALGRGQYWSAHLYGGAGFLRYNLATSPPETTPDAEAIGWAAIAPLGIGFQRPLGPRTGLDLHFGYTYTLRDDLNRAILEKGNDGFWTLSLGLVFGDVGYRPPLPRLPLRAAATTAPAKSAASGADRDGDGLTDRDERLLYFTNPVMADSDGDGLNDGEEVNVYGTNPNRLDSDNGGVRDGAEIARGADPLDPGDDFVPSPILEAEPPPIAEPLAGPLPTVFFPAGGLTLIRDARDNLDIVAAYLREHPTIALELHGHSDSVGSRATNLQLSRRRAEAVKEYLVAQGIDARRLPVRAVGESRPIASNATEEGRLKNRRVDLVPR